MLSDAHTFSSLLSFFVGACSMIEKYELRNVFQGVVHREVKTGFGSYVLKTDTLMQSTRLIFEKKSKFDTFFEGKAVENLYFCSQINRNLHEKKNLNTDVACTDIN